MSNPDPAQNKIADFLNSGRPHFVFDFDGTLIPIRSQLTDLMLPEATRAALAALARFPVTVISGRKPADLERALDGFAVKRVPLNGLIPDPRMHQDFEAILPLIKRLLATESFEGVVLERKAPLLAIHFRESPVVEAGDRLAEGARQALRECGLAGLWHVFLGKKVVNIEPREASKCAWLQRYLTKNPGAHVVFAGDDMNDLDALNLRHERLRKIGVRSDETPHDFTAGCDLICDQQGFIDFLNALNAKLP